jgi:beta-glucanase (GH16 family)
VATLTFASCQKEDDLATTNSPISMIDPDTPKDARPYFVEESLTNGKTKGVPSIITDASKYKLTFSDEFNNGTTLDAGKWTKETDYSKGLTDRDKNLTWWGVTPDYVAVGGGYLKLSSYKSGTDKLYCGSITSDNKIETQYGYFEAYIDIIDPASTGTQTAFWLQGDNQGHIDGSGNDGTEVDIFESSWLNNVAHTTVHCDGYAEATKFGDGRSWTGPNMTTGYHYFGCLWRSDIIAVYYDGVLACHIDGSKYIPRVKEYIKVSVGAAFGNANTGFSKKASGSTHTSLIDWVRVYQKP